MQVEVVGGPMDGLRKTVVGSVLTLGRDEPSDLTLPLDASISTRHARIVREQDHFWLEDLESRNGTYLGDRRIRQRVLIGPGTLFTMGRTIVEFSLR
jgi:pSer/pThr/pTyr-binding forkhead associated (FHA) protein